MFLILSIAGSIGVLIIANLIFNHEKPQVSAKLLSTVFAIFSVISFLGGLFLAADHFPEEDTLNPSYIQSLAWLISGIVVSSIFSAISVTLNYLHQIELNTKTK